MDKSQLKQRIVGAMVLVALGVIFIPMILSQGENPAAITATNIPQKSEKLVEMTQQPMPATPPPPQIDTQTPQLVDAHTPPVEQQDMRSEPQATETETSSQTAGADKSTSTTATPSTAKKQSDDSDAKRSQARGYVVQVASLSARNKAIQLRDKLRGKGFASFVESVPGSKGIRYRVRVGPEVRKEDAIALKKKIVQQFRIKDALVMVHP